MSSHANHEAPSYIPPPDMAGQLQQPEQHRLLLLGRTADGGSERLFGPFAEVSADGNINESIRVFGSDDLVEDAIDAGDFDSIDYANYVKNPPANHVFRGNHVWYNAPKSAEAWLNRVTDRDFTISLAASRRMLTSVIDRGKARFAREQRLLEEPATPLGLSDEEALLLRPREPMYTPTREDFRIKIDTLGDDRETVVLALDSEGREPTDPDYVETWKRKTTYTLGDIERYMQDRQRGSVINEALDKYLKNPNMDTSRTELTIADKAVIGFKLAMAKRFGEGFTFQLEHMDAIKNAEIRKHAQESYSTGPDDDLRSLFKFRPDALGTLRDGKGNKIPAHLEPVRNKLLHDVSEVLTLLCVLAEYDGGTSKASPDDLFEISQGALDLGMEALALRYGGMDEIPADAKSRLAGHILGYLYIMKGSEPHGKNTELVNPPLLDSEGNIQWETDLDANGKVFFLDAEGRDVYQGDYELIDTTVGDIRENRRYIGPEAVYNPNGTLRAHGNIVYDDDGNAYHKYLSKEDRANGLEYTKLIPLKSRVVQERNANGNLRPKLLRNADRSFVTKPSTDKDGNPVYIKNSDYDDIIISIDDSSGYGPESRLEGFDASGNLADDVDNIAYYKQRHMGPVAQREFVVSKKIVLDKNRFAFGTVKLEDVVTDMTERQPGSQTAYVQAAMELHASMIVKMGEIMDLSLYIPGYSNGVSRNGLSEEPLEFHKGQKIVTINGVRTVVDIPHPKPKTVENRNSPLYEKGGLGQLSENYRQFLYALSQYNLLYGDLSRGAMPSSGDGDESQKAVSALEQARAAAAMGGSRVEMDASSWSMTPNSNALTARVGKIVKALARRHGLRDKHGVPISFARDANFFDSGVGRGKMSIN